VTRAGCFLDGCDFGTVTDSWTGVRFPPGSPAFEQHVESGLIPMTATASLAVHPVQLYLSLNGLVLAAVATVWVGSRRSRPGEAFFLYWGLYALTRFALEFLRGDAGRGFIGPLSTSQAISLPVLAGAALGFWWRYREGAPEPRQGTPAEAAVAPDDAAREAAPPRERSVPIEVSGVTALAAAAVRLHIAAGALWASLSPAVWIYLPLLVLALRRRPVAGHGYDFASWRRGSRWLFLSIALVLVPVGLAIVLFRLATGAPAGLDPAATALSDLPFELLWVVVPEELFFRGYVQGRWRSWARERGGAVPWEPVVLTAALFATAHVLVRADPISAAVFFPGLVMSWLRERSGGLLAPAGFHLGANLLWRSLGY
jgi:membrane protease YdiL (CAAX protease family)